MDEVELFGRGRDARVVRWLAVAGGLALTALRRIHSGHIGDYVTWLMVGMAVLGALVGLPLT